MRRAPVVCIAFCTLFAVLAVACDNNTEDGGGSSGGGSGGGGGNTLIIDTASLPGATIGQPYSVQLQSSGGTGTYS